MREIPCPAVSNSVLLGEINRVLTQLRALEDRIDALLAAKCPAELQIADLKRVNEQLADKLKRAGLRDGPG